MKKLTAFLVCVSAMLLPSCKWCIGEYIRADSAVHVGADTRHPVGGEYYTNGTGESYYYAPEVTYRTRTRLTEWHAIGTPGHLAYDIKPTGRVLLVKDEYPYPIAIDTLPQGAEKRRYEYDGRRPMCDHDLGYFDSDACSRGSLGAQILAAPFDFCIDPLLSVVGTVVGGPFCLPLMAAEDMLTHQQQQPVPYPEQPLAIPEEK